MCPPTSFPPSPQLPLGFPRQLPSPPSGVWEQEGFSFLSHKVKCRWAFISLSSAVSRGVGITQRPAHVPPRCGGDRDRLRGHSLSPVDSRLALLFVRGSAAHRGLALVPPQLGEGRRLCGRWAPGVPCPLSTLLWLACAPYTGGGSDPRMYQGGTCCGLLEGQKHQPLTPASHHHTWETNSLQLNPQESIQGMLP